MSVLNLINFDSMMKDMYALPGTRLKQWVVDTRRENAWESATCPLVEVEVHKDNTDSDCRNCSTYQPSVPWTYLQHDCCDVCETLWHGLRSRPDIAAWLVERAARPPVEADHSKLSDEIEPDPGPLRWHTLAGILPR